MKKSGIAIPFILAGFVLLLVLISAFLHKDFKRSASETLALAKENKQFIGSSALTALKSGDYVILKIGLGKIPPMSDHAQVIETDFNQLMSAPIKSVFKDTSKKKVIFAVDITAAVKAWTFLSRMGYDQIYVYNSEDTMNPGKSDTISAGNEVFHYTFKPEKLSEEDKSN